MTYHPLIGGYDLTSRQICPPGLHTNPSFFDQLGEDNRKEGLNSDSHTILASERSEVF